MKVVMKQAGEDPKDKPTEPTPHILYLSFIPERWAALCRLVFSAGSNASLQRDSK